MRFFFSLRRADALKPTTEPQETPKHQSHSTAREVVPPSKYTQMMDNGRGSPIVPARQEFTASELEEYAAEAHGAKTKNAERHRTSRTSGSNTLREHGYPP
ncbi:hypothetical protein MY4038_009962 [Beauveria bassiana]